ncbi:four helix bundle protein [Gaetbulibacter aestuarii]|uniref:Four helix bundle protein n=1 Tax=Gaetbulibacter aestuarii TaxID=1502358 RepID=A0ABW7MV79_9FLAO
MEKLKSHQDLRVWQEAMDLVTKVYELTKDYPKDELYGLTSQIRRSAVSIPSNIAEGAGRNGQKELIRFLYIAMGSLSELETQLEISKRLHYISDSEPLNKQIYFIRKMLSKLIKSF